MMNNDLKLLDCTLRDGGYINDWNWGHAQAKDIIRLLIKANIDIIEIGFLRNVEGYTADTTVCNHIEELQELISDDVEKNKVMFSAMAMRSNYDINKLSDHEYSKIDLLRITAHDYDIREGMNFALAVKEKGYKLSINPINIMGYSDDRLLWIFDEVNKIMPYQFSIVDTFGSMRKDDLDRIVSLADHNLDKSIRLGLHLHENMAQSFSLAQSFIQKNLKRSLTIDGSLLGMGRVPGNLPIELISDYLNRERNANYDIDYIMDAIQDYIEPIKELHPWGYSPAYFLSAKYNLHRNYAEYYLKKGDLTNRDINHILSRIDISKTTAFDQLYAENLYQDYLNHIIDDTEDVKTLQSKFKNQNFLIIAPGTSIKKENQKILEYIEREKPVVISVNFIPKDIELSYAFFSNNKRFDKIRHPKVKMIVTSNLPKADATYQINYNSISSAFTQGCNSLIMLLNLLIRAKVKKVTLAGADGYTENGNNYYDNSLRNYQKHGINFNQAIGDGLKNLDISIDFLTSSEYEKYYKA